MGAIACSDRRWPVPVQLNGNCVRAQKTGKSYNIADIRNDAEGVLMPPLLPPPESKDTLVQRADDTEEVIKNRLRICAFLLLFCLI